MKEQIASNDYRLPIATIEQLGREAAMKSIRPGGINVELQDSRDRTDAILKEAYNAEMARLEPDMWERATRIISLLPPYLRLCALTRDGRALLYCVGIGGTLVANESSLAADQYAVASGYESYVPLYPMRVDAYIAQVGAAKDYFALD